MSAPGLVCRGLPTPTSLFFMVIVVVVLGCRCASGRPQSHQDSREARAQSALRFSPELLLEPSLESAASPASVLPHRPSPSSPSTHHHLPSPYAQTKENNHKGVPGDDWQRFSQDLDGPEEKWEQDPDVEDSDIPPTQRWSERTSDLPGDKVVVPPVVMDDLNVDRLHGALTGFNKEDGNEDLDVPELRLKDRDSDPFRTAGSGYIRAPHKVIDQGVPSPELLARDVDVDGPPLPSAHIPMPDDVPADPRQIVPWQAVLEKDVDVDRPIHYYSSPQSLTGEDASRQQWKKLALKNLDVDKDMAALTRQDVRTDVDVDAEKNPFEDDEEENEVPEELIRRVVHAMDAPPPWRASSIHQDGEVEDIWAEGSGDSDENADQYIDWVIQEQAAPRSSRLIAMIFEIMDDPEEPLDDEEEGEEEEEEDEEEEHSAAAYEKELSIWQILTNFPFPMLVSQGDETAIQVDYIYDDDDDDDYDDEYDEDDYYDDDEYEDDEDYDDDDEEEDSDDEDDEEDEKDDDLDDYFYSEGYDECRDCTEDDGTTKQEMTVLSLAPMLTR